MNLNSHGNEGEPKHHPAHHSSGGSSRPYWQRAHHDWKFWVGLVLMLTALAVYVLTEDLSMVPRARPQIQPVSGTARS
jgi:hypothetical protein